MVHGHVLGDFAKSDREWLDVLLDAIADNAELVAKGDDNGFMNKITLALREKLQPTGDDDRPPPKEPKQGAEPHPPGEAADAGRQVPETGPMAAMLKKLLGGTRPDPVCQADTSYPLIAVRNGLRAIARLPFHPGRRTCTT